jgi:hypothetical protein
MQGSYIAENLDRQQYALASKEDGCFITDKKETSL